MRFGDKPAALGEPAPAHWTACQNQSITEVKDEDLAEYLIGYSAEFELPQDYWPQDKGRWTVCCVDSTCVAGADKKGSRTKKGNISIKAVLIAGPNKSQIGKLTEIPVSGPHSIRRAITEGSPTAIKVKDILLPSPKPKQKSRLMSMVSQLATMTAVIAGSTDRKIRINKNAQIKHGFVAFTSIMQVLYMQQAYCYSSILISPEPKTQKEACKHADAEEWIHSEFIEMDTIYNMGMIVYMPISELPKGCTLIPTKITYKWKFGPMGKTL